MKKIICLLISALIMSCSQVNVPITQESKATPKPIQSQTVVVNNQVKNDTNISTELKPEIKTPITPTPVSTLDHTNYNSSAIDKNLTPVPTPTPTVTPVPSTSFIQVVPTPIPSDVVTVPVIPATPRPSQSPIFVDTYSNFSVIDIYGGYLNLIFKDVYKIRFNIETKKFYSLAGYDTESINQILISNDIKINPDGSYISMTREGKYYYVRTEEELEEMEKYSEKKAGGDVPNWASIYTIIANNNIRLKDLEEKLKNNIYVRGLTFFDNNSLVHD